jgi:WD40 repeat protein
VNATHDFCFLGSTSGAIYTVSLSVAALNITHTQLTSSSSTATASTTASTSSGVAQTSLSQTSGSSHTLTNSGPNKIDNNNNNSNNNNIIVRTLRGHSRGVTSLSVSRDNSSLVSVSEDGALRVWDLWNGQCIREVSPLNKCPLTNAMVSQSTDQVNIVWK